MATQRVFLASASRATTASTAAAVSKSADDVSTVEENLEMFGTLLFILVVLAYFARLGRSVALRAER